MEARFCEGGKKGEWLNYVVGLGQSEPLDGGRRWDCGDHVVEIC